MAQLRALEELDLSHNGFYGENGAQEHVPSADEGDGRGRVGSRGVVKMPLRSDETLLTADE